MANVVIVVFVVLAVYAVLWNLRRSRTIVARRGVSIGADLGTMRDKPRMRVREVNATGPDRVHVVLDPDPDDAGRPGVSATSPMEFMVKLAEDDFGFDLLRQWRESACSVAVVVPPDSRLVRLRAVDSLQPLTLSRLDD